MVKWLERFWLPYFFTIRYLCLSKSCVKMQVMKVMIVVSGCSQMTSAFFWGLWHPLVLVSEPKTIIFRTQFISIRVNRICVTKGVQLRLVRPTKACFRWIPSNRWIFHHSSSFLMTVMTLGPSSSAFVSFLSYRWLFNVATSFVNGPY